MISRFSHSPEPTANGFAEPGDMFAQSDVGERLKATLKAGTMGQRALADFILRHPVRASVLSIEDLARATGVSAPTISRFARELGYGSFAGLRAGLGEAIQILLDPVAKLSAQLKRPGQPDAADMLGVIQTHVARLDAERVAAQVATAVQAITAARSVHVMGFGLSAHLAAMLVLGLQPFHAGVSAVVEYGGTEVAAGRLMAIGPEDLLIAIAFPRYAKDVVNLSQYARDRGARVIAITDSPASPLAGVAELSLMAPASHPALSSSYAAALAITETLVAAVMLSDPANAERAALLGAAISGHLQPT
jgi:DNA-binding MurR/RpiR family transcriptional regulator